MANEKQALTKALGKRLIELRGDRTLTGFADSIGLWPATLTNYENGRNLPGAYVLSKIAEHEDVDLNWLVTGHGWHPDDEVEYFIED